jgi:hypothetical protein
MCAAMSYSFGKRRIKSWDDPEAPFFGSKITVRERTHMKRAELLTMLIAAILMPATRAQGESACSFTTAAGKYGLSDSGTVIGIGPRVALALLTLDATGNVKGKVSALLNDNVTHSTLTGTYTVNSDFTGALSFSEYDLPGPSSAVTPGSWSRNAAIRNDRVWNFSRDCAGRRIPA